MKKTSAEFKGNEGSIEALNAKHSVLERTLQAQQKKVADLSAAYKAASEALGENNAKTQSYEKQLYNAQAELANTQRELNDTDEALQRVGESADESGEQLGEMGEETQSLGSIVEVVADKLGLKNTNSTIATLANLMDQIQELKAGFKLDVLNLNFGIHYHF